jgi:hypothetical protein
MTPEEQIALLRRALAAEEELRKAVTEALLKLLERIARAKGSAEAATTANVAR